MTIRTGNRRKKANGLKVIILGTYVGLEKRNYRYEKMDFSDNGLKVIISLSTMSNLT